MKKNSMEPFWDLKISKYVENVMCVSTPQSSLVEKLKHLIQHN